MSDEESFVILGSSSCSSLDNDGLDGKIPSMSSSLHSDTPDGMFTSLESSQINDLKNARDVILPKSTLNEVAALDMSDPTERSSPVESQILETNNAEVKTSISADEKHVPAGINLWNIPPKGYDEEDNIKYSLEHYALKSIEEKAEIAKQDVYSSSNQESCKSSLSAKAVPSSSIDPNLATRFIMGEVKSDELKASVYSQNWREDMRKLQDIVVEYAELKATINKANITMKQFYNNSLQWKERVKAMEEQHTLQMDNCKAEIEELRKKCNEMENNFKLQIEALEIARKKDREESIQEISEKNALLHNMRAHIVKLENQQSVYLDSVGLNENGTQNVLNHEHEIQIKNLQRRLSELLASNLDFKDIEKQYIDELNCLKVNLTASEELIRKNCSEIDQLQAINVVNQTKIQTLEQHLKSLQIENEEQKERILLLETQNAVHRTDFELEKESRETAVKEKGQILQDLRSLQRKNQQLIEEHQKMAEDLQKKLSAAPSVASDILSWTSTPPTPVAKHMCPICSKAFKSLNILLSHVNDCVDKN